MSRIVAFRERVMAYIRDSIPDLAEVDWYDGLFSADDVKEWSMKTPCAWVSVTTVPTEHHSTGELTTELRVVVAVIDGDRRRPRDADTRVWEIVEGLAVGVNLNTFEDENAGPATGIKIVRISDPDLRGDGISIGVVEWRSSLTIGDNRARRRDEIWHNGRRIEQMPTTLKGRAHLRGETDTMDLDGDGYQGDSVLDRGVYEPPVLPAQRWEPEP